MNIGNYDEPTAKGAKLLDKILPGWYKQVDLKNLRMQSSQLCMLGQLFGSRVEGQLAREMYPEEYAKAKKKAALDYGSDYDPPGYVTAINGGLVDELTPPGMSEELMALKYVCRGTINTRCNWSDEVAKRLAADEEATKDED